MKRTNSVLALVAATATIAWSQQTDWRPSKMTPAQLGAKIDRGILSLSNAEGRSYFTGKSPEGEGTFYPFLRIKDRTHYSIEYNIPQKVVDSVRVVADGTHRGTLINGKWTKGPIGAAAPFPRGVDLVSVWPNIFPKLTMWTTVCGQGVWTELLTSWGKGLGGSKLKISERQMKVNNKMTPFYQILVQAPSKHYDAEIIVDGRMFLPLTVKTNHMVKDGKATYQWGVAWGFGMKFEAKIFRIP